MHCWAAAAVSTDSSDKGAVVRALQGMQVSCVDARIPTQEQGELVHPAAYDTKEPAPYSRAEHHVKGSRCMLVVRLYIHMYMYTHVYLYTYICTCMYVCISALCDSYTKEGKSRLLF